MKRTVKILSVTILVGIVLFLLCISKPFQPDGILQWQPPNAFLTAVVLLLCYGVKSILVFFPITVLQIAAGYLFSPVEALLLNMTGQVTVLLVPYLIGRKAGTAKLETLTNRYPKIREIIGFQRNNELATCFLLRACAVPPGDVLTACLGATGVGFRANMLGGVLGCLPSVVLSTFLGANIRNPQSWEFWLALGLNLLWIIISTLSYGLFRWFQRKKKGEKL